jgi:hypothetical protein
MKQVLLILTLSILFAFASFATTKIISDCKTSCRKALSKNEVAIKKSVLELAKRAAQISSSHKDVFPDFIIGSTFYKL